jgi:hypothetical protein
VCSHISWCVAVPDGDEKSNEEEMEEMVIASEEEEELVREMEEDPHTACETRGREEQEAHRNVEKERISGTIA